MPVYLLAGHDPFVNHIAEMKLMERVGSNGPAMILWRNTPCVVIGRHQNPWTECNLPRMRSDSIPLVRRVSGGGAVYHDLGNTNFSFITRPDQYDQGRQFGVILQGLASLGIRATLTPRNDITVDGRKISGNAFRHTREASLHHGTLLVSADLTRLAAYLTPGTRKIETHATASVRSTVMNLSEKHTDLTHDTLCDALVSAFSGEYGDSSALQSDPGLIDSPAPEPPPPDLSGWEWLYGMTPAFTQEITVGGSSSIRISVRHGVISGIEPASGELRDIVVGCRYSSDDLLQALPRSGPGGTTSPADTSIQTTVRSIAEALNEWTINPSDPRD